MSNLGKYFFTYFSVRPSPVGTPAAGLSGDVKSRTHGRSVSCLSPLFWFGQLLLLPLEVTCRPFCEVSLPSSQPGCLALQTLWLTSAGFRSVFLHLVSASTSGCAESRCRAGFPVCSAQASLWSVGARASVLTARGLSGLGCQGSPDLCLLKDTFCISTTASLASSRHLNTESSDFA